MNKPHKHAQLMLQYAQDAAETNQPWERWQTKDADSENWRNIFNHPNWFEHYEYRRKPRVIVINGIEVPEPMREKPVFGTKYWLPMLDTKISTSPAMLWENDDEDNRFFALGICHATRESAELHAEALLSFTKNEETK